MTTLIHGPFARTLEAGRDRFNALFAQARWDMPRLDADAFANHLGASIAPIVEAVAQTVPEKSDETAEVLFELSLRLVGKEFLGPRSRYPQLADGWDRLLRGLPRLLAAAPRSFAGAVGNALYNLSITPNARPAEWTATMLELGPRCPDLPVFLDAGKVVAWRAGLAHYRDGALDIGAALEPSLARAALGIPAEDQTPLELIVHRLRDDPWLLPAAAGRPAPAEKQLRIVARVGAFRGFGGLFLRPPRIALADDELHVTDGESCWLLRADIFGATLHRVGVELPHGARTDYSTNPGSPIGAIRRTKSVEELQLRTSFAATRTTLAVTTSLSHAVYLLALMEVSP
jgi:hypothetical protein